LGRTFVLPFAAMASASRRAARYFAFGGVGLTTAGLGQAAHLRMSYVCPEEPMGKLHGHAGPDLKGPPLRLLFVGDSVCIGVGAKIAGPLQSACAERLAKLRKRPVEWSTVGASGADVRELHELFMARQKSDAASGKCGGFDLAVVFCGVNDSKKLLQGRSPSVFREDLDALCASLRKAAPEGHITVPSIAGYKYAPLLQLWPMRHFVDPFLEAFEAQKEVVAKSKLIYCISPPPDSLPSSDDTRLWSSDGIHPSLEGYNIIGDWLGTALALAHA